MPFKALIFDLFHTLTGLESERADLPWTSDVLGIDRHRWNEALTTRSRWRLTGEEQDPFTIVATLARAIDPDIPEDRIREASSLRLLRFRQSMLGIPAGNVETLRALRARGFRLALLSNADVTEIAAWQESPLAGLFEVEIFSCTAGCVKPERAIYEKCLAALGLSGPDCLFVGDGGSNELVGAREAGMSTVFVSGVGSELWPDQVKPRLAISDYHVRQVPELLELLQQR